MKKVVLAIICAITCTFVACKKHEDPTPQPVVVPVVTLYPVLMESKDPYTGQQQFTGITYMLLKTEINSGNKFSYNPVYTNHKNGYWYSDDKNLYIDPVLKNDSLKFGSKISANIADFRARVNTSIANKKYALILLTSDGGTVSEYNNYSIVNINGELKF